MPAKDPPKSSSSSSRGATRSRGDRTAYYSAGPARRLLWVQFEGYRADNSHTYGYDGDPAVEADGRTFYLNRRFYRTRGFVGRPGSDGEHAMRLLERRGLASFEITTPVP